MSEGKESQKRTVQLAKRHNIEGQFSMCVGGRKSVFLIL